jgi:hypothetical protein
MDQGIIHTFKMKYRKLIIENKLKALEYGYETEDITILDSINFVNNAWKGVTSKTISNCFRHAGFKAISDNPSIVELTDESEKDQDHQNFMITWNNFSFDVDSNEYLNIDNDIASNAEMSDNEIINYVSHVNNDSDDDVEEIGKTSTGATNLISKQEMLKVMETAKMYYLQSNKDARHYLNMIDEIEEDVKSSQAIKQSNIHDYFNR